MKIKNKLKLKNLRKSKRILLPIVVFDFLFLAISYLIVQLFDKLVMLQYNKLFTIDYDTMLQRTQEELQQISAEMGNTLFILISLLVVSAILILVNWSFFQHLVYSKIANKKFNIKSFPKFLLLNFVWILFFIIILAVIQKGIKSNLQTAMSAIVSALFIYFTNILYILFTKNNKVEIKQTFKLGVFTFYKQAVPYLLLALILIGLINLNTLFQYSIMHLAIPAILTQLPFVILALLAIDLTRIYTAKTINL